LACSCEGRSARRLAACFVANTWCHVGQLSVSKPLSRWARHFIPCRTPKQPLLKGCRAWLLSLLGHLRTPDGYTCSLAATVRQRDVKDLHGACEEGRIHLGTARSIQCSHNSCYAGSGVRAAACWCQSRRARGLQSYNAGPLRGGYLSRAIAGH